MGSPTQRSLDWLRERGWVARKIEQRLPFPKNVTRDVFGGDILAVHPQQGVTLIVQATSGANHNARVRKCLGLIWEAEKEKDSEKLVLEVKAWLQTGNKFEVHSWSKKGPRGKRKLWELRSQRIILADFPDLLSRKEEVRFSAS